MSVHRDLTITIAADELPSAGEVVAVNVTHNGVPFTLLIENLSSSTTEVDEEEPGVRLTYEVVDVAGATRTHAAVVRNHERRSVVNRWSLCSRSNSRRVTGRRRDQDLSTVTCTQCRARLVDLGEL